jgi:uncharacterized protein
MLDTTRVSLSPRLAAGAFSVVIAITTLFALCVRVYAFDMPQTPHGYVNDYASVLSSDTVSTLDADLAAFEASTTNQIAVAIVPDMNGDYVEHYATKLFEAWGIGTKTHDNGVLLVLSVQEHAIRIEVGYGLEGALPDSVAQSIIGSDLTPNLKAGNYDAAVSDAVRDIMAATQHEYTATSPGSALPTKDIGNLLFFAFFLGSILVQWLGAILGRSKSWWLGGVIGGGVGLGLSTLLGWWIWNGAALTSVLIGLGLLFDYIVSNATASAGRSGGVPPWWAGGPGGFGGGSLGGGGGFGGFGGGRSGGGGASGSW